MIQPVFPSGNRGVRLIGAGAYVPPRVVRSEEVARAIPGYSAEWIEEKTGIRERRFLWGVDAEAGVAVVPDICTGEPRTNSDMCEVALRRALQMAGIEAEELDAVFLVTCSPDRPNFSHDAMEVHRRLGCRADAYALVIDDGCGGTPYVMDMAHRMIRSGAVNTVAVIGSTCTSPYLERSVYGGSVTPGPGRKPIPAMFGMYVFGDGAGAAILRAEDGPGKAGVLASFSGNDHHELVVRRADGVLRRLQGSDGPSDDAFVVNGQLVARSYSVYMKHCIDAVLADHPELRDRVSRYYFHQPNKRLLDHFVAAAGLPADRVACNVDRYGNTSAAGMLIMLAEDLEAGVVELGGSDVVLIAAIGANVHFGAQLIRL